MMGRMGGAIVAAMIAAVAAVTGGAVTGAWAQDAAAGFPNKPIRVIVPFAAGGGNDIFARLVGNKLSEILGQPVINENKPGPGGRIAAEYVMNQPKDGYTLFIGASGVMSIAAAAYPNLSYHPTRTFIPLTMIANFPLILVVPPDHPAKNVKELVEWAKKNPDKSNYASTSPAFTTASELLKLKSGMPGKVKALAVTGSERSSEVPDVPSMAEAGYPEVNIKLYSGYFAATGTPPAIVAKVEAGLRKAINDPGVSAKLKALAVTPGGNSGADFRAMIDKDIESIAGVIKAANLKFEN